jgi:CRISPR-associated protein (TIGR02710 family)
MKALLISIGTGVRPDDVASIVHGLLYSIRNNNPSKTFFVVSEQSKKSTLPQVVKSMEQPYEIILLPDTDDVNKIYECLLPKYKDIKKDFDNITVDYTSGTKAMSAALAILGSWHEANTLSYVSGQRHGGVVIKGTEKLLLLQPYQILVEKKLYEAVSFFNKCQFDTSLLVVAQIEHTVPDPVLLAELLPFKKVILAYSAWDKFNHQEGLDELKDVKVPTFDANKAFLGKLCSAKVKEPYHIADLINNAKRRGDIEQKYDDAVARLYRTMELIAQYKLKEHGIEDTSNVTVDKMPPALAQDSKTTSGKTRMGLEKDYLFLDAKGDDLGRKFVADNRLKDLLHKRNSSILAHGMKPVSKEVYQQLSEKIFGFASLIIKDLDRLLSDSTFRQWPT